MTEALTPHLRLIDLSTNAVLATTQNILDWSITLTLDGLGQMSIEVPAGDPGDAASSEDFSFAQALLQANSDVTSDLTRPLLIELSLDGGTAYDSRRLVRQPQRSFAASRRTIKEGGADLGDILGTVAIERATYLEIPLQDILDGAGGTLVSQSGQGIRYLGAIPPGAVGSNTIPHLAGVLTKLPGLPSWPHAARLRLQFGGLVSPEEVTVGPGLGAIRDYPVTLDVDSSTVLNTLETLGHRLAGVVPDQAYGHVYIDCSDASLNLSSSVPTSWSATPIPRSVVVGHVGETPHLTFDATGSLDVDETTHARVHLDQASAETDDSTMYAQANMVGGSSRAGFPDGSKITGLSIVNARTGQISTDRDLWSDCCPVMGLDVGGRTGGVYFCISDGEIRRVVGSPALPCHSLAWDAGHGEDRSPALLMGTTHGIFYTEDPPAPYWLLHSTWQPLGNLNADVTRIMVEEDPDDVTHRVVFALVKGAGNRTDGIYRWTSAGGWASVYLNSAVLDMVTTDYRTAWLIVKADQTKVYQCRLDGAGAATLVPYAMPGGVQAYSVQRVLTVDPDLDSIWALATDGGPKVFFLLNSGGTWGSFQDANASHTLVRPGDPNNAALTVYRAVGLGITMDQSYGNAQLANVLLCTDAGVYWLPQHLDTDPATWTWAQADMGGLTDTVVNNITAGEGQTVLGTAINRVFCTTEDDLLISSSTARWFYSIKGRNRTDLGPYLAKITGIMYSLGAPGLRSPLPDSMVRTWGSANLSEDAGIMLHSPLGLADNTHVYIGGLGATTAGEIYSLCTTDAQRKAVLPVGLYFERYLDDHLGYQYRLVSQAAQLPGQQMQALPQVQTNAAQDAETASTSLAQIMIRWLQQHSESQTRITLESHFENPASGLRNLRPSHRVALVGTITLVDRSSTGAVVSSQPLHFDGTEALYVLQHTMKKGPGRTATTTTLLGTEMWLTPLTAEDMDTALQDQLHTFKIRR